uniref:Uncharacterized protein n=1 Tax=viral metagenome TaxID=1070528 RepID=A0A6C0C5H3_9ZZZZ
MIQIISVVVLICYLGLAYKFRKNNMILLLLTLIAILVLCNMKNVIEGQNSKSNNTINTSNKKSNSKNNTNNSKLNSISKGLQNSNNNNGPKGYNKNKFVVAAGYQMGPYDGLVLTLDNPVSKYVKQNNVSLGKKEDMCVYQGIDVPLKCDKTLYSSMGPSITGVPDDDQNLFMLYRNKSSPECCPSTFSTSTGCVCTTEDQRNYINRRGMIASSK